MTDRPIFPRLFPVNNLTFRIHSHSFLNNIKVEKDGFIGSASFKTLGIDKVKTDGDIDRLRFGVDFKLSKAVVLGLGYRFLRNERDGTVKEGTVRK